MATAPTHQVSPEHVAGIAEWLNGRGVDEPQQAALELTQSVEFQSAMRDLVKASWVDGATSGMGPADIDR